MTTNLTVIEDALRGLNVIAENESASTEQGTTCLRRMNQMLEAWTEDGIDLGYFKQSSTADTIPIPEWAELGVTAMLSVRIAPNYGATVSPELADLASTQFNMISRKSAVERLEGADMSHMPAGQGRLSRNILTDR